MDVIDSFNNQFMLHHYLSNMDNNLLYYLENNSLNINYYCFFFKIIDNVHYVVTSNIVKRENNGHRLIIIKNVEMDSNSINHYAKK